MPQTILAVPGLKSTTPLFRARLWELAHSRGWNADAIAAVISSESAGTFRADIASGGGTWRPGMTKAFGLIQFLPGTARKLGIEPEKLAAMPPEEQLLWVAAYFERFGKSLGPNSRPVDYYLATFLPWSIGAPDDTVLVRKGFDTLGWPARDVEAVGTVDERRKKYATEGTQVLSFSEYYDLNRGLDRDGDGTITVADMARVIAGVMDAARGERIPVEIQSSTLPAGPALPANSASVVPRASAASGGGVLALGAAGIAALAGWHFFKRRRATRT